MEQAAFVSVFYDLNGVSSGYDNSGFFRSSYWTKETIFIPTASNLPNIDSNLQYIAYAEDANLNGRSLETNGNIVDIGSEEQVKLAEGTYVLTYSYTGTVPMPGGSNYHLIYQYTFNVTTNHYPLKKWTITDVINRCVETVIPLRYGEKPKFRLQGVNYDDTSGNATTYDTGSIAEEYDKIIAPEMTFTKMTLREMLQQVGGYVHAEPRITAVHFEENGERWYEIGFDKYGGKEKSRIKSRPYSSALLRWDINDYATGLDSSSDNLVSQLDYAQGVVVEPFNNGFISLRTENTTARLQDDNGSVFIPTTRPIYQIKKVNFIWRTGTDIRLSRPTATGTL